MSLWPGTSGAARLVRRKGELSASQIERDWPHQVALPASADIGANYPIIESFCAVDRLTVCRRRHRFRRRDEEFIVYCFGNAADADRFCERFSGEVMDAENPRAWRRQQEQQS